MLCYGKTIQYIDLDQGVVVLKCKNSSSLFSVYKNCAIDTEVDICKFTMFGMARK